MRTRFTQPPGVSFLAIGLQTGFARGLEIDNPSGSWLYIPQNETAIPPYTIGWAFRFAYDVSSFDIIAGQGPAGQVSTTQGDAVVIYLTDLADAPSENALGAAAPGVPFINQFTPYLAKALAIAPSIVFGGTQVLLPPIIGSRYRIMTAIGRRTINSGSGGNRTLTDGSSPLQWLIESTTSATVLVVGEIAGINAPGYPQTLPVDAPLSEGLTLISAASYCRGLGVVAITYQVI